MAMPMIQHKHLFANYSSPVFYDEMVDQSGKVRTPYAAVMKQLAMMGLDELTRKYETMQAQMMRQGITFTMNGSADDDAALERTIPFDLIPRIITGQEWQQLETGLKQRTNALNCFIADCYNSQNIIKDGLVPREIVVNNPYFLPEMVGMNVPNGTYIPLSGIDIIRSETGEFYVLEDNLRTPSGLSYVYKNRSLMATLFSELFYHNRIRDIDRGLSELLRCLRSLAPNGKADPLVVLLTPGIYNAAYYDHTFLAQEMGIELVESRDLTVIDRKVYMRTMRGLRQVDVIYRRVDDEYLDPTVYRPDSVLDVPGLIDAYLAGNVALANAPGTGVADDKAIYAYVPDMIRYYLNEEPLLNNVPTYILSRPYDRKYVLSKLSEMVVKERSLSGGYGMLIGPSASEEELGKFAALIEKHPERYIAQPTMKLSCSPSLTDGDIAPRHIDLRAFVFTGGAESYVVPGGLTRVALEEGSLIVNSSQGGGTKDTWII
ncbi:circularly permuted type 2 ATP-grasp protein [Paenibacillus sp. MMS18-CY102]|uniref:circularly permuted type 2 ATP-grasp protein n=1 Tax=Paenibacillus sp. MMS18-CY102 TaxID=2682849 RepID=UPI001365B1CA|nr:circularly permuted type 2 ATP-grasp protein [Paenibacillus sp. MMS18-CY102]MWC31197.1 circularly permuted type 2 ATP-grasp protein [Paenibacillus sp. MMS18-CY102]